MQSTVASGPLATADEVGARPTISDGGCRVTLAPRPSANGERTTDTVNARCARSRTAIARFKGTAIARCITRAGDVMVIRSASGGEIPSRSFVRAMATCSRGRLSILRQIVAGEYSSIVSSWRRSSVGHSNRMRPCITRTECVMTTDRRTLSSGSGDIPQGLVQAKASTAPPAPASSTAEETPRRRVLEDDLGRVLHRRGAERV